MEEKVSSELKLADLRIESFRRSLTQLHDCASALVLLNLQWKDLEDHFSSIHNDILERLKELHSVEDTVQEKLEDVEKREEELLVLRESTEERLREAEVLRESAEERIREAEAREKEFDLIQEKEIQGMKCEFELIEKSRSELEAMSESIETKSRLLGEKEERLRLLNDSIDEKTIQVGEIEKEVSQAWKEIEIKEKQCAQFRNELKLKEEQIEERSKSLALEDDKFNRWRSELEAKEKELDVERKELALEALDLELKDKLIQERCDEVELGKKKLMERCEEVELKEKEIQERCERVELEKKKLMERCKAVELKEKKIQERCERVELEKKKLMERCKEVELKERQIQERCEKVELQQMKLLERCQEVELEDKLIQHMSGDVKLGKKKLMERCKEVELEKKLIQQRCEGVEVEKKKLMERYEELELKEKLVQERCVEVELEKKKLMERYEEVELKQKQLDERCREFELKDKKHFDDHRKPLAVNNAKDYPADSNLHFTVSMDGKALQIFLNEHCNGYDSMRNDVFVALGLSSDPAKLVLDAIQGFYPPHLKKGDKEFETDVIRRSCILLLEQLMKISTDIRPPVRKEAMRLAFDWITKMKTDVEVLGFLQLLASYGLASAFDADELLIHLEFVAQHRQAPELFRALGFSGKVSGFIQNLIRKKQRVEAIGYIHAFELVNEFPPVPLLNDFLRDSKIAAKKLRKKNRIKAANKRIADVRRALRCIEECKIEYGPSVKSLKETADCLERDNSQRKAEAFLGRIQLPLSLRNKKRLASSIAPLINLPETNSDNQLQQLSGNKRPRIAESEGKSFDRCSGGADQGDLTVKSKDKDVSASLDHQMKDGKKIAGDLQLACDPGKLVLDVMNVSFPFKLEGNRNFNLNIPKKCCIFLIEQLRSASFQINPETKDQAKEFALHWQTKLENDRDDPWEVICFLQFIAAYKLASIFNADKLLGLLDTDYWCEVAPDLCQVLGLTEKIPKNPKEGVVQLENQKEQKPMVIPTLEVKTGFVSSYRSKLDQQVSGASPPIASESDLSTQLQQKSGNKSPRVHFPSLDPPKVSTGATSTPHLMEHPVQHPLNLVRSDGVPCMNAPPNYSSMQPFPQHLPGSFTSQDNPSMNLSSKHDSSLQAPLHHLPGSYTSQGNPCMNAPLRQCSSLQPRLQQLPGSFTGQGQGDPRMNVQPPPQQLLGLSRQGNPDCSMQPPLQYPQGLFMSEVNPSMNAPPRHDSSMQPPLQHQPGFLTSQGDPCMNAAPRHYSPMQPPMQNHSGFFMGQGVPSMNAMQSHYNMVANPYNQQSHWNGFCNVPAW